jgi:hypothetical protein
MAVRSCCRRDDSTTKGSPVADVLMLAITVAFFVLCVAYVGLCDRIIGEDPLALDETTMTGPDEPALLEEAA